MEDKYFKLGPREMQGEIWDERDRTNIGSQIIEILGSQLVEILISHQQDVINSIRFTYRTGRKIFYSPTYGEPTGSNFDMVQIGYRYEAITSVRGELMNGRLVSIVFGTNRKTCGPFGRTGTGSRSSGTSYEDFKYELTPGRFGGFHGSVHQGTVYAIGVYVKPYEVYTEEEVLDALRDDAEDDTW